jgi:hypothetical protein
MIRTAAMIAATKLGKITQLMGKFGSFFRKT